jgi:6-phosphogluconate dehydrogenase
LASLSSYDGLRSTWLPTNMAVALRDARDGSGYERVDRPRGEIFHSDWK